MALKDKTQRFGTTEKSDPSFHLDIFDRLYEGNLIITKRLSDEMIDKLIENKEKCILHMTCTGLNTLEPVIPLKEITLTQINKLIEKGFPVNQIVLRVDPIIPTEKGTNTALSVISLFKDTGISRVRISFLDMYYHVRKRFSENNIKNPYPSEYFHAPEEMRISAYQKIKEVCDEYNMKLEMCGEIPIEINGEKIETTPCLSQTDVDILGLTDKITLVEKTKERIFCGCPENKTDLILGKPQQCPHKCLYCFWKNK